VKVGDLVEVKLLHFDPVKGLGHIFKPGLVIASATNRVITVRIVGEEESRVYRYFGLEELRVINEVG
jgi:hypothetical protein